MNDRSRVIDDFRVTRTADGLRIDVLDYHVGRLELTRDVLEELGFVPAADDAPAGPRRPRREPPPRHP